MKTYKMVDLHITQEHAQFIILAMELERSRLGTKKVNPKFTTMMDELIAYTRNQLLEAETPTEVDRLINKIAEW